MAEADSSKAVAGWLGVATAIIGLLAFFGIQNYDDLKYILDPASANVPACRAAERASEDFTLASSPYARLESRAATARHYAEGLQAAAAATKDKDLQAAFHANIATLESYVRVVLDAQAQLDARTGFFVDDLTPKAGSSLKVRAIGDESKWRRLCS